MGDRLTIYMLDKYYDLNQGKKHSCTYDMLDRCHYFKKINTSGIEKRNLHIIRDAFAKPDENEIMKVEETFEEVSRLYTTFRDGNWYTWDDYPEVPLVKSVMQHLNRTTNDHVAIWYCLPQSDHFSNGPQNMSISDQELSCLNTIINWHRTSLIFIQPDTIGCDWCKCLGSSFQDASLYSIVSPNWQSLHPKCDWMSYENIIDASLSGKSNLESTEAEEYYEEEQENVKELDPSIKNMIGTLTSYVNSLHPLIYINHFDFRAIDEAIQEVASNANAKCIEFNNALGLLDFETKSPMLDACSLEDFLRGNMDEGFDQKTFLILKDVHEALNDQVIIALLKRIAEDTIYNESYSETIFILSEMTVIPPELEDFITIIDFPLPNETDIRTLIDKFISEKSDGENILEDEGQGESVYEEAAGDDAASEDTISEEAVKKELTLSFKGLNEFQIKQILNLAYQEYGTIDMNAKGLVLREKKQYLKKSGLLEIINTTESADNIGGLENLKDWLKSRAEIFKNLGKAVNFGVDIPKGILIAGMPGCGKSLTAKATAGMFEMPLVRLDVGRLLGKYVGESEENMRKALKLAEAISPCVLWIDEIEKAFAGVGGEGGGNDVTTRLFGQFLTWMQEKESTVFIVATANDISNLPPEFLRKGRFDEVFFVDLPNDNERKQILEIHLKNRKKWKDGTIKLNEIASKTNGFSGADLESVVKETILTAFIQKEQSKRHTITTDMLENAVKNTSPISKTLGEKIERLRKTVQKYSLKPASK